jgi:hypothetical protein
MNVLPLCTAPRTLFTVKATNAPSVTAAPAAQSQGRRASAA